MQSSYQSPQYYSPKRPSLPPQPPPPRPFSLLSVLLRCGIFIAIAASAYFGISFAVMALKASQHTAEVKQFDQKLSSTINPILAAHPIKISVAVDNLQTDSLHTYDTKTPLPAASTGKLITALAYYHAVEQGKLDLTHMLGSFSAGYQMQQMINQSNNDSWELLVQDLGRPALQRYATSIGSDYDVSNNTLSAGSLAATLAKLYDGTLLNDDDTNQLLSYMQHTNDDDLIPAALPVGVTAYHKYGLLDGTLHDAAILTKGGQTYVLVIYTQNDDDSDDDDRTMLIHQLTSAAAHQLFTT